MRLTRSQIAGCVAGEVGAEIIRLERWRGKAMRGLEEGRREREGDPIQVTFLNALPQVDTWVRNLDKDHTVAFWLPYPQD